MPNRDQTGPEGMGSKTGLQDGDCVDSDAPSSANTMVGRGRRWWRGRNRRQRRHRRRPARRWGRGRGRHLSQEQQVENLKGEAVWLQEQLDAVSQQIEEIAG